MREPGPVLLVSTGVMLGAAIQAADILAKEDIICGILHVHTVKPLDAYAVLDCRAMSS